MLLENKIAILYGGGGHVGAAVARAFAAEGARVHLTGRSRGSLESLADEITAGGGHAETAHVDATDAESVEAHYASVVERVGAVDISFNMIGLAEVQGQQLVEMTLDEYLHPVTVGARSHFITATAAARQMSPHGRGVIMTMTPTPARLAIPLVGGFGPAHSAIEGMLRTLAAELGPTGVRVCWLRSAGSPESWLPGDAVDVAGQPMKSSADSGYLEQLRGRTLLRRFPTLAEVGQTAALLASDRASAMTAAAANITCGQIAD